MRRNFIADSRRYVNNNKKSSLIVIVTLFAIIGLIVTGYKLIEIYQTDNFDKISKDYINAVKEIAEQDLQTQLLNSSANTVKLIMHYKNVLTDKKIPYKLDTLALIDTLRNIINDPVFGRISERGYVAVADTHGKLLIHPVYQDTNIFYKLTFMDENGKPFGKVLKIKEDTANKYTGLIEYKWFSKDHSDHCQNYEKKGAIEYIADLGWFVWSSYYYDDDSTRFIEALVNTRLREKINSMKLLQSGYIFIYDLSGKMLVHRCLTGINVRNAQDQSNKENKFNEKILKEINDSIAFVNSNIKIDAGDYTNCKADSLNIERQKRLWNVGGKISYSWFKYDSIQTKIINENKSFIIKCQQDNSCNPDTIWNQRSSTTETVEKVMHWQYFPNYKVVVLCGYYRDEVFALSPIVKILLVIAGVIMGIIAACLIYFLFEGYRHAKRITVEKSKIENLQSTLQNLAATVIESKQKDIKEIFLKEIRTSIQFDVFWIYEYDSAASCIKYLFGYEKTKTKEDEELIDWNHKYGLTDPKYKNYPSVVCYNENRDIITDNYYDYLNISSELKEKYNNSSINDSEYKSNPVKGIDITESTPNIREFLLREIKPQKGDLYPSTIFIPLIFEKERVGVITLQSENTSAYSESDLNFIRIIGQYLSIFIKNKQLNEQKIILEKKALIGDIFPQISHELNHPIHRARLAASALSSNARKASEQYLENKLDQNAVISSFNDFKTRGNIIRSNLIILEQYLDRYKLLAKDYKLSKEQMNISEFVYEILESFQYILTKEHIQIRFNCAQNIIMMIYPYAIIQILSNLMDNAIKYAWPNKYKIKNKEIQISIIEDKNGLIFQFSDNGVGINRETLPLICEPSFTTNKKKGTGLGLVIVKRIVEDDIHGRISIQSDENKGFRFQFTYPNL